MSGLHGYPRPQLERAEWFDLDGEWEFSLDPDAVWKLPDQPDWKARIRVPFSPETSASGIGNTGFFRACWYRRQFDAPELRPGERLILHFCAVDYSATVWVNGAPRRGARRRLHAVLRRHHRTPESRQSADRRRVRARRPGGSLEAARQAGLAASAALHLVSREPPASGSPSGSSGSPSTYLGQVRWTPNVERWEIGFEAWLAGERRDDLRLNVKLYGGDTLLADDTYAVVADEVHRRIALSDPGIDDYRNELLWSPATPTLIQAELKLIARRTACCSTARAATRRSARSARRATSSCSTAGLTSSAWCSIRAIGPRPASPRPTTTPTAATSNCKRPWASMARASTRRSRARGISTGPTRSGCWSGRRCRARTASPARPSSA